MSSTAPVSARLARNDTLDGLKYVAAATIVLHHVAAIESGGRLGAFITAAAATALFFFFAVSGYLHGAVGGRGTQWRLTRLTRLGVPYAFWSVVYLVWAQRDLLHGGAAFTPNPLVVIFFAGAHGILWFLPMLLACALVCDAVIRDGRSRRIAIVACAAAVLVVVWSGIDAAVPAAWVNFVRAPLWLLAYLGGMEIRGMAGEGTPSARLAWLGVVAALGAGALGAVAGRSPSPLFLTAEMALWTSGALLVLLGAAAGVRWLGVAKLAWGRDYLIGIYLCHVLWLAGFIALVSPNSINPALWIPAAWVFVFTGASLTTWALKSFRLTRPVVL